MSNLEFIKFVTKLPAAFIAPPTVTAVVDPLPTVVVPAIFPEVEVIDPVAVMLLAVRLPFVST